MSITWRIPWRAIRHALAALPATVRSSSRSLRRAPGFVAIATLSLGAALGLSTGVFALIDAMRHPESPYRAVDQLYSVNFRLGGSPYPTAHDVDEALAGLRGVIAHSSARPDYTDVEFDNGEEREGILYVRPGFFDVLGVRPRLGHVPSELDAGGRAVAVVSDELWRSRFNNRSRLEGATIGVGDRDYTIVGVMPARMSFRGAFGRNVWIPDPTPASEIGMPIVRAAGGSADTVLVQSQLNALTQRWTKEYRKPTDRPFSAQLTSVRPDPLELQDYHRAMIGAAICVLIIACANVVALMLARGMVRSRDYALRLALGANRVEVAREVVVEVAVLAFVGCVAGALMATWAVGLITRATPAELHWQGFTQPQWSARVFATSGIAVLVSIAIAGGFPAWQASRTDPMGPLKENSGGAIGRAGTRFRWLVITELALSMMLVMGSSLMVKSAVRMANYDFGYDARRLISAGASVPRYFIRNNRFVMNPETLSDSASVRLAAEVFAKLRALPGVQLVSYMGECGLRNNVITTDRTVEGGAAAYVPNVCKIGSAGLFATLGFPIADGRDFIDGDDVTGAIILNERAARKLYPHERAIGRLVKLGDARSAQPWLPIVGIVKDRELNFNWFPEAGPDTSMQVFATMPSKRGSVAALIVKPKPGAIGVDLQLWKSLRAAMPPGSTVRVTPWVRSYLDGVKSEQFVSLLFVLLGFVSLALGAAGLFSVISYIAGQRNREFAVRIALGATKQNILQLVMKEALLMALGGTAVGAGLGMWAGFLLWNKMWGVYPVDAQALVGGETTLLVVTMLACLAPALRATRANPVDVLRAS